MSAPADPLVVTRLAMATPAGVAGKFLTGPPRPGVVADVEVRAEAVPAGPGRLADRPTTMTIDTLEALLPGSLDDCPPARRGLVLGSGTAGIDQSMTVTGDSLTRSRPFNVNPALVPACVMNYAGAQCAIRFDLRGPNVTVTAGRVTGLAALAYARRLLLRDRAELVVCGAFEDLNDRREAITRGHDAGPRARSSEGCCAFLLESAHRAQRHVRPVLARVLAIDSGIVVDPGDEHLVLSDVVARALARAAADPGDIDLAVFSADENRMLDAALPNARWVNPADVIGDTLGAAAAFQLALALLTETAPGRLAAVISTDPDGQVGCAILTGPAEPPAWRVYTDSGKGDR